MQINRQVSRGRDEFGSHSVSRKDHSATQKSMNRKKSSVMSQNKKKTQGGGIIDIVDQQNVGRTPDDLIEGRIQVRSFEEQ